MPSGVAEVGGDFRFGDLVDIRDLKGKSLGRGLINYDAAQMRQIAGKQTSEISAILGGKEFDEVIHRNNLALID